MDRKDYLKEPVNHIKINGALTVDQLMQQFKNSGSFGAGRLAAACDIYEKMLREKDCTVFLALSGAVVPAGMRTIVVDLIRNHLVDVIVSTGACMVHDAIEAIGGHHYKGGWAVNDVNSTSIIFSVFTTFLFPKKTTFDWISNFPKCTPTSPKNAKGKV